ncbi:hypothetical protein PI125_g16479 [Phytophthora idaei]|nr:hypothetical protein PI125_g16479 [Phytophthora idaei]
MKTLPTFYVGRLKRYHDPQGPAAPQAPQASREEEDPTPRNENQPQTSSNIQRRKAKTHAALVDREASGTPEGLRTVEHQLGKPSAHHSHTAEGTAERTRKSASPSAVPGRLNTVRDYSLSLYVSTQGFVSLPKLPSPKTLTRGIREGGPEDARLYAVVEVDPEETL